ncbi:hypothetical protein [Embleya scabrispora]|uniref:hypothetical protein n=1 Tax=Embleya scabrispora TaxID=159449 RepID=UPI0011805FC5|nr:hypothetical protein [Embleya scabrispora]
MIVTGARPPSAGWPVRTAASSMLAAVRARVEPGGGRNLGTRVEGRVSGGAFVLRVTPRAPKAPKSQAISSRVVDLRRCAHVRLDVRVSLPPMVALTRVERVDSGGADGFGAVGGPPVPVLRTGSAAVGRGVAERARATRQLYERGAGHGRRIEEPGGRPAPTSRGARPDPSGAAPYTRPRSALTFAAPAPPAPAPATAPGYPADPIARDRAAQPYRAAPAATALTSADLPRLVDGVVREIDRRVLARQERRGWSR